MSEATLSPDDEGKEVRASSGELLGHVDSAEGGTAYVAPTGGRSGSELGRARDEEKPFPPDVRHVAETAEETVSVAERRRPSTGIVGRYDRTHHSQAHPISPAPTTSVDVMATRTEITEDDEGKEVVGPDGEEVGRIVDVEHGTAHVDPDPGITETVMSKLGWGDRDEDTYPLQEASVETITDNEVRLRELTGGTGRT